MRSFVRGILLVLGGVFGTLFVSANDRVQTSIPIINIETENQIERKEYVYCSLSIIGDIRQEWISSYDSVRIRGWGNTTWEEMPKKAYKKIQQKRISIW